MSKPANRSFSHTLTRRSFALGGLMAAAAPSLVKAQEKSFAGKSLVFTSWGGFYQQSQDTAFCQPFAAATGARVVQDGPMNEPRVRTMVAGGSPEWDVCDVTDVFLFNGIRNGLFEKVDYSIVDRSVILPAFANDYGVGADVWSYNVAYNTDSFPIGKGPKTWADLFDTKAFPGKRSFRDRVYGMLEIALMADGVEPSKLYPIDVDRAFKKLDTIKNDITFWSTTSQAQQLLVDNAVSCGVILNGRAFDAINKGGKLAVEWAQNLQSADYLVILKGSKSVDVGQHLLKRSLQVDSQAKFANLTAFAPVNPAAFSQIDSKTAEWLPTSPENTKLGVVQDAKWWEPNLEALTQRWNRWKLS
jgi:putative spermidine/putrescine transport system substrate-binding protein